VSAVIGAQPKIAPKKRGRCIACSAGFQPASFQQVSVLKKTPAGSRRYMVRATHHVESAGCVVFLESGVR